MATGGTIQIHTCKNRIPVDSARYGFRNFKRKDYEVSTMTAKSQELHFILFHSTAQGLKRCDVRNLYTLRTEWVYVILTTNDDYFAIQQ